MSCLFIGRSFSVLIVQVLFLSFADSFHTSSMLRSIRVARLARLAKDVVAAVPTLCGCFKSFAPWARNMPRQRDDSGRAWSNSSPLKEPVGALKVVCKYNLCVYIYRGYCWILDHVPFNNFHFVKGIMSPTNV